MAFLGADTEELREVGQEFQEGKETTDQVITFLKALIAILKAASFFSGGASLAYATYLETTVVPWLEKISMALGMFAKVLGAQADAQDEASNGGTVDYGSLPSYQSPALPEPIQPYQGEPLAGGANAPIASGTDSGSGASPSGTSPSSGAPSVGAPLGGSATTSGPSLSIGENGHLMIDTGIDLDGEGVKAPEAGAGAGAPTQIGSSTVGPELKGSDLSPAGTGPAAGPAGGDHGLGSAGGIGGGGLGADAGGSSGSAGGSSGGGGGGPVGGAGSPAGGGETQLGGSSIGSPSGHTGPVADGGLGGAAPGAESLGSSSMGSATPTGEAADGGASYGAAAGIAGGAAALGLGGAALASRAGGGSSNDPAIDKLASTNGRGSRGEDVKLLQDKLTAAGYDTKGADGVWGGNTQAAYDAYRADNPLPVQHGSGYTSPSGYDYNQISGVNGNPNVTPEFLRKVEGISQRIGAQPEHLMAAMSFETGGEFASDTRNPRSSATGLIQFMSDTARGLGTTTADLAQMSPIDQLDYVERYFEPHRGRLGDLESVYTSILAGSPHSGDEALFTQGDRSYGPNRELDANRNGVITAAEATAHVRARMGAGGN
ncbi:peptidoglycan-binding domain-containing protein [Nocardioides sp. 1609]|uniref:peptidoglycan-binding domain-containing protein n=1 Tax=Nocardioides sp. 1609 TaxID=2508327 RepID=UPI00107044FC|nr:peptidoglycan-binding domain-containing protein [Nocardioides sp. 1609]